MGFRTRIGRRVRSRFRGAWSRWGGVGVYRSGAEDIPYIERIALAEF